MNRRIPILVLFAAASAGLCPAARATAEGDSPKQRAGPYEITLMPISEGLFAGEEMELEFRVAFLSEGSEPVPVLFARFFCEVDMPSMPGMARFQEVAHREGVPGVYGVHPTLPHGGDYRFCITLLPPEEQLAMKPRPDGPFTVEFPLEVADVGPARRARRYAARPYGLDVAATPRVPAAGEKVDLELRVRLQNSPDLREVRDFDLVHEKPMHLFLVRRDLSYFAHEHPQLVEPGVFRLSLSFPAPGDYRLFADVAPRDAGSQVLRSSIAVSPREGASVPAPAPPLSGPVLRAQAGGVSVQVAPPEEGLPPGRMVTVVASLSDGKGRAVEDLEPWLGALAHLLLIHEDAETFAHAHPDDRDPGLGKEGRIPFLVRLPKPGLYRGWLQFQRGGRVLTAELALQTD